MSCFFFVEGAWKQVGATVFSLKSKKLYSIISTIVACAVGPSVITSSTDFSFQNLGFWNLFEFSVKKIIQYSRTFALQVQPSWNQADAPLLL